jgi:uncharacterized delta-60 repeat protein
MVARSQPASRAHAAVMHVPARDVSRLLTVSLAFTVMVVVLLCAASSARAEPGDADWVRTWNAARPGVVWAAEAKTKPGGGVYVAASLLRPSGNVDIAVLRYSAAGKLAWVEYYDGPAHGLDAMEGLAVDRRGNVIVCGSTFTASGKEDWVVLKYGPDGRRRWKRTLGASFGRADVPEAVAVDAQDNVVVAGSITRRKTGGDWCVAKYDPRGTLLWRTTLTRTVAGFDQALALVVDPDDAHIYVTGRMFGTSTGDDVITVRYRPDGRRVWRERWDGAKSGPDRATSIALSDGGVAVAGVSASPASGDDGLVLKYTRNGILRWAKIVDGGQGSTGVDRFAAVGIDTRGNVVCGGSVTTSPSQGEDLVVVRFQASGAQGSRWQLSGAADGDAALDLYVTPRGRTYVAGTVGDAGGDAVVAGLSDGLALLWPTLSYDRAGADDLAQSVTLSSGAAYVAGVSGTDLLVMKVLR